MGALDGPRAGHCRIRRGSADVDRRRGVAGGVRVAGAPPSWRRLQSVRGGTGNPCGDGRTAGCHCRCQRSLASAALELGPGTGRLPGQLDRAHGQMAAAGHAGRRRLRRSPARSPGLRLSRTCPGGVGHGAHTLAGLRPPGRPARTAARATVDRARRFRGLRPGRTAVVRQDTARGGVRTPVRRRLRLRGVDPGPGPRDATRRCPTLRIHTCAPCQRHPPTPRTFPAVARGRPPLADRLRRLGRPPGRQRPPDQRRPRADHHEGWGLGGGGPRAEGVRLRGGEPDRIGGRPG